MNARHFSRVTAGTKIAVLVVTSLLSLSIVSLAIRQADYIAQQMTERAI